MLSICIPIYNSDVTELVASLLGQMDKVDGETELLVIDDGSDIYNWNPGERTNKNFKYIYLDKNIGRASIRNYFLSKSKYSYLLFIDGDSSVISDYFLQNYLNELKSKELEVLCGGSIYQSEKPNKRFYLRWRYSTVRESKPVTIRNNDIHLGFKTNNFIIKRSIFESIRFNENLTGYGHEDTLFGFELLKAQVPIRHIENPVLNRSLDDNETFLSKSEHAVKNLCQVLKLVKYDQLFIASNRLCRTYFSLKKTRISWLIHFCLRLTHPLNYYLLSRGFFILPMFDIFKLKNMMSNMDSGESSLN